MPVDLPTLAHTDRLWLLLALVLIGLWVLTGERRRRRAWTSIGQGGRPPGGGRGWRLAAMFALVLSLAQPRWGRIPGTEPPPGHDVVILVDTSRSMAAQDALPDRLGAAVGSALSLVSALGEAEGDRAAVVAYAGRGVVKCPLTANLGAVADALRARRPGEVRPGGTDLAASLEEALDQFDDRVAAGGRSIVVLGDGEDPSRPDAADRARKAGVRARLAGVDVHAGSVGVESGSTIPSGSGVLRYQGKTVLSRRDDAPLKALAEASGGTFLPLGPTARDLGPFYRSKIAPTARARREVARPNQRVERAGALILLAAVLALLGDRPRRVRWPLLLLGLTAVPGADRPGETARQAVEAGRAAYAAGDTAAALIAFDRAISLDPEGPIPRFDAGAALYRLARPAEAAARYREAHARSRKNTLLRMKVDYALGNTALALGDAAAAIASYDGCLGSTDRSPATRSLRADALANRRFAEQHLPRPPASPPEARSPGPRPADPPPGADPKTAESDAPPTGGPASPTSTPPGGAARSPSRASTPEGRLAEAMDNLRAAARRRPAEPPPPAGPSDGRDW